MDTPELGPMEEHKDTHNEEGETTKRKKWTKLETRQLIALFKENENLWNIQSKDYGRKLKKRDTLQHIADKFKVDPSEVSRKLHNLRVQFCYELKKMKEKSLEQGSDEMIISKWPHFSSLLFLGHPEIIGQLVQNTITDDTELPLKEEEVIHNEEVETTERKKWTDWETRQLITLFKENESLWNRHSKDYRNRMKKRVIIRHIAEILKVEPDEVLRKMHNLRTQFSSELRKIKERSLDQEPDDIYTSSWPYFSSLLFITHPPTVDDVNKVGLLDIDLCGPSIPYLLGLENQEVHQCSEGWVPVYLDADQKLAVMSIGFLLKSRNDSVVWRGPKKTGMIRQFLSDVYWQDIDYLVIDTPPGTSDEHITVMENLRSLDCQGAILVTTPQAVAIEDVRKELTFCRKTGIPVIGVLENMSGYVCPNCSECTNIFSSGGGASLAEMSNIRFLGRLPIDSKVAVVPMESELKRNPDSTTAQVFKNLVKIVMEKNTKRVEKA